MSSVFVNDTASTEIYTLSLHDALPISRTVSLRLACGRSGERRTCSKIIFSFSGGSGRGSPVGIGVPWAGWDQAGASEPNAISPTITSGRVDRMIFLLTVEAKLARQRRSEA